MITRGKGALGRLYERLRKRSYRRVYGMAKLPAHRHYVKGVREALQAVEAEHRSFERHYNSDINDNETLFSAK